MEERTKLELQPITFQGQIPSTSSATVSSDTVCSGVSPGTSLEQSPRPVATSPTTVSSNIPSFDTVSSDVLCETVSCDLECTHTSSNLTSPAETCNSKTEYNKRESRCGIMVNAGMQFPLDVAQEIFSEHSYCSFKVLKEQDSSNEALQIAPLHATLAEEAEVSDEVNSELLTF